MAVIWGDHEQDVAGALAPPPEVLTLGEWHSRGRGRRRAASRSSHAVWEAPAERPDPVTILEEQARSRVPELVAIRHGRMMASEFAYARLCGWALSRAHARTCRASMITGYLGDADTFDQAIGEFASSYADQNELDYRRLVDAVSSGRAIAGL